MANWLFKEEPSTYTFADLLRDGKTTWTGVANPLALKHLRSVQVGDRVLFYATGARKAIVGEMRVTRGPEWPEEDPKAVWVEVQPVEGYDVEVRLADVKADASLAEWELVRMPRLSVMPVTEEQWKRVQEIRQERAGAALGRTRNTT